MRVLVVLVLVIIIRVFCPRTGPSLQAQETMFAVLLKAGLPPQTQEPTLQFCPKAGLLLQTQEPSLQFCTKAPGIFSYLLTSIQMLKSECGAESKGKLLQLFIHSNTTNLVPEFEVEELPLDRTATLVLEFGMRDLPLGRTFCCCCCCC